MARTSVAGAQLKQGHIRSERSTLHFYPLRLETPLSQRPCHWAGSPPPWPVSRRSTGRVSKGESKHWVKLFETSFESSHCCKVCPNGGVIRQIVSRSSPVCRSGRSIESRLLAHCAFASFRRNFIDAYCFWPMSGT